MGFLDSVKAFFKGPNTAIPQTDPNQTLQADLTQGVPEPGAEQSHASEEPAGSAATEAATTVATEEPPASDTTDEPAPSDGANP
jgi:hypothetical protein